MTFLGWCAVTIVGLDIFGTLLLKNNRPLIHTTATLFMDAVVLTYLLYTLL